jgi:hypothetical protein
MQRKLTLTAGLATRRTLRERITDAGLLVLIVGILLAWIGALIFFLAQLVA